MLTNLGSYLEPWRSIYIFILNVPYAIKILYILPFLPVTAKLKLFGALFFSLKISSACSDQNDRRNARWTGHMDRPESLSDRNKRKALTIGERQNL
jgi:hypothetical protein